MPFSPLEAHRYSVNQVEWSPDGSLLCSCSLDGMAALWQSEVVFAITHFMDLFDYDFCVQNGQRSNISLQSSGAGVRTCRFSPDGRWVVTGGDDEKAVLRSLPSGAKHG
jgi:WD40 repeat protein